jgi:hypothetical protein
MQYHALQNEIQDMLHNAHNTLVRNPIGNVVALKNRLWIGR